MHHYSKQDNIVVVLECIYYLVTTKVNKFANCVVNIINECTVRLCPVACLH